MGIDDEGSAEWRAAREYLQDLPVLIRTEESPRGRLAYWEASRALPRVTMCSFTALDGRVIVPNAGEREFAEVLAAIRPELSDTERVGALVRHLSPVLRSVLVKGKPSYLNSMSIPWHLPEFDGTAYRAFFENMTSGRVERISIDANFNVSIEDVSEGIELGLL